MLSKHEIIKSSFEFEKDDFTNEEFTQKVNFMVKKNIKEFIKDR